MYIGPKRHQQHLYGLYMSSPSSLSAQVPHAHTPINPTSSCSQQLCQHCCCWWCCPSCSCCHHHPCCAILALLLALAVTLLACHCSALVSLALIPISTHNPPYEQGLVGLGQVQPHSFLSPSPPHCPVTLIFPPCKQALAAVVVVVPLCFIVWSSRYLKMFVSNKKMK